MKRYLSALVMLAVLSAIEAQVHYVPAQILIPTLNASNSYGWSYNHSTPFNNSWIGAPNPNNSKIWNNGTTPDGNLSLGTIGYMDRLLFNQIYYKSRRWWATREAEIEYPKDVPGGYVRHETISAVRCYNQFYDGPNNSNATVKEGGPGRKYVKIQLRSRWGRGFKYLVQIFGH